MDDNEGNVLTVLTRINSILQDKCNVCEDCQQIFVSWHQDTPTKNFARSHASSSSSCSVCLGILSNSNFLERLRIQVKEKFKPYTTGKGKNFLCKDAPTIVLPPIILIRAQSVLAAVGNELYNSTTFEEHQKNGDKDQVIHGYLNRYLSCSNASDIYTKIKEKLRSKVRHLVHDDESMLNNKQGDGDDNTASNIIPLSHHLHNEEAGYMNYHILISSSKNLQLPPESDLPLLSLLGSKHKKRERKRFRGNDPTEKQGGDPRANLEKRVKASIDDDNNNDGSNIVLLDKNDVQSIVESIGGQNDVKKKLGQWIVNTSLMWNEDTKKINAKNSGQSQSTPLDTKTSTQECGIHITCWRNRFYLKGKYTKARRDISQTPFYVNLDEDEKIELERQMSSRTAPLETHEINDLSNKKSRQNPPATSSLPQASASYNMKKLGITSVEEEICPVISKYGCNGISSLNNEPCTGQSGGGGKRVFGMCKFHASGREDMDVRMILPPDTNTTTTTTKDEKVASGRPFVCEVIDALEMPTSLSLEKVIRSINQMDHNKGIHEVFEQGSDESCGGIVNGKHSRDWMKDEEEKEDKRIFIKYGYGNKPVGISGLEYCPSSSFKNLQSETEEKVKFYGCLCWSKETIPNQVYLDEKLGCVKQKDKDEGETTKYYYPLRIEQSTPLRVLHRRSAGTRVRHVLSLKAHRINNHWFRLHLSTSAGTYVKEFVHGDCGRTYPSVSSLMGGKTDIVELDCEGIAI